MPRTNDNTLAERFWAKVNKNGPIPDYNPSLGPCWVWTAYRMLSGYCQIGYNPPDGKRKTLFAHRVSYELNVGPIPGGLVIDHLCRVRHCMNPAHLEPVTMRVNIVERGINSTGALNSRKTHCIRGHALTPDNLFAFGLRDGYRKCKLCKDIYAKKFRAMRPELRHAEYIRRKAKMAPQGNNTTPVQA